MGNLYSVKVIIKSNSYVNPFHVVLKESLIPKMESYSRGEAIKAAIKSLEILLNDEHKDEDLE